MAPTYVKRAHLHDLMIELALGVGTRDALRTMSPTDHRDHHVEQNGAMIDEVTAEIIRRQEITESMSAYAGQG